jgi:thioredoxin-like negative regulator of GroEL
MWTTFVRPGSTTPALRTVGWLTAACMWLAAIVIAMRKVPCRDEQAEPATDALFRDAQTEYLRGNWYQVQNLLGQLLERDRQDVDAGLMLASLYRRVNQTQQAREQLRRLARCESSAKWGLEIQRELEYLDRMEREIEATNIASQPPGALSEAA